MTHKRKELSKIRKVSFRNPTRMTRKTFECRDMTYATVDINGQKYLGNVNGGSRHAQKGV